MRRFVLLCLAVAAAAAQTASVPATAYYSAMRWRFIGPTRPGRAWVVAGVPGDPAVYYLGTPAGALWKSTNAGTTWSAISDALPVTGFGAVAVAPSNPSIVYAGTGNTTVGDGVYRSDDAGATWQHVGLEDTKYVTSLVVDPKNPDIVVAGVGSGGNFGSMVFYNNNPSPARGVYRTMDGGRTWSHTLFVDASTSAVDLAADPADARVVFASLAAAGARGQGSPAIYRSADEGATWTRVRGDGLPPGAVSASIALAPRTNAQRVYALAGGRGGGGLYRSDDGGATWTVATRRLASAGGHIYVDPTNPDVVYTMGTSVYRSMDGGHTIEALKGAPGGDDPHAMWIDPGNPRRMIVGADQGPTISVDGGATWTPWYTVANGELYYVTTDQQFPYRVYAAQQDSGTVSVLSRSDYGEIRSNDWYSVSGYEEGHIFSDPLDPRYVYTNGNGHAVVRFDKQTGQSGPVYTPANADRFGPRPAMEISSKDQHWIFLGAQYVLASTDRVTWNRISPDLTTRPGAAALGRAPTGTIVALAPSPLDLDVLWAGTSNGIIQVTRDRGKTWTDVSPPQVSSEPALTIWSMEASSHDRGVAYASAIDLSDTHAPCLLMTRDFGGTWRAIVNGLPADVPTRVVREDPRQSNLLYAGTQAGMFVSFNRGGDWQSLQLNLPRIAINDITVHGNDLVIATWGRGLWVLDDVGPLRQIESARSSQGPAFLYPPADATRVRWDENQDTPLPPEVPAGENPPDGAVIDFYLRSAASDARLTIRDARGALVREFTSTASAADTRMPNVPEFWFSAPAVVPINAGMHRFVWDLRYPTPPPLDYGPDGNPSSIVSYGIVAPAIKGQSPRQQPIGPLVLPGTYTVALTVGGNTTTRDLRVVNDPRSPASPSDLEALLKAERSVANGIERGHDAIEQLRSLRQVASERGGTGSGESNPAASAFDRASLAAIQALTGGRSLAQHLAALEYADLKPTASTLAAIGASCARADQALDTYRHVLTSEVAALNAALAKGERTAIPAPEPIAGAACAVR
jgi:photosystem II stability/assembly factor-like uncharacterized protein